MDFDYTDYMLTDERKGTENPDELCSPWRVAYHLEMALKKLVTVDDEDGPVTGVSLAPNGRHIVVGLNNSHVQIWDSTAIQKLSFTSWDRANELISKFIVSMKVDCVAKDVSNSVKYWSPPLSNCFKLNVDVAFDSNKGVKTDGKCAICKSANETTMNVLWMCNKLKNTRKEWLSENQGLRTDRRNFFDCVYDYFRKVSGKEKELFCILLWRIWFCRNSAVHNTSLADFSEMIGWSKKFQDDYYLNNGSNPPETSNHGGIVQRCLQFGLECGLNSTKIESDEATVIKWINHGLHRDTDYGMILSDIDVLKADIRGITFSHIPSSANKAVLSLAKIAMGIAEDRFWLEDFPDNIRSIIQAEKLG
ncbi:hypothetical protein LWI29_018533 [Acer saccharum]|uniref:RNase H type-1 domain-containing protein n=1 Tax=Acer saccharum TaxID=4024 RepID=A0AA39S499_ACESA|nr:hypothetical protein LWI29_018533 [Acer saccharum]